MSVDAGDEYAEVWNEGYHRARKEHKCSACSETIRRGDLYSYTFSVFDGNTDTVKRCARCETMYQALLVLHRGGETTVDPELKCGHIFEEVFEKEPPPELARLAFMTPAEMQAEFSATAKRL
jgi:hypothetical protein